MNRNLLIFALILIVLVGIAYLTFSNAQSLRGKKTVDIHGKVFNLEIADTPDKQSKGLSQRDTLQQDQGMLFTFNKSDTYTFWMKDMRFPIDMIFVSGEKVVTIHHNVQPFTGSDKQPNLSLYSANKPADKVIEINGGLAEKNKLKEGDSVKFNL